MRKAGYSERTADSKAGKTLDGAIALMEERAIQGDKTAQSILDKVGISKAELFERYREIALKSNQHSVSLLALAPLLRSQDIELNPSSTQSTAPNIHIGIVENTINPPETAQNNPPVIDI
jgi:hypothetical protein